MDFISLFAGIGGFDLGFERAGMRCVAQVEIDPFCRRILAKHWPHVPRYGDIRDVGRNRKNQLPNADVICGGFPCQPHSTAGKRKGAADDRDLWPEYFRIVDEYRPAWVVGENVLGIRTTILDKVLSDLESLDYATITFDLPAAGFNAPHIRERIFIIANAKSSSRNVSISTWEQEEKLYSRGAGTNGNATNANSIGQYRQEVTKTRTDTLHQKPDSTLYKSEQSTEFLKITSSGKAANQWDWRNAPSAICRMDDGIPYRLDRIRTLGNAVMPQITEFIARSIVQAENAPNKVFQPTGEHGG